MERHPFTVLMVDEQTGRVTADHLYAPNSDGAMRQAAKIRPVCSLIAAIVGHIREDSHIYFPGEGLVSAETYLSLWAEDPEYPFEEWQCEVARGDTRRGYEDWVAARREEAVDDPAN